MLTDIDLQVEAGEVHALLGPNGSGKTTLLRILVGLVDPDRGEVRVLGQPPADWTARRRVGWMPAGDRSFYLRLNGLDNLLFFARIFGLRSGVSRHRALEVLGAVGLADAAGTRVGLYSQGMKRRLLLARALLAEPAVLLLDEATHDLDPEGAGQACRLVREAAARGAAVVWATQRLDEIRGLANQVTVLGTTATRFVGSVADLASRASDRRFVVRLGGQDHEDLGPEIDDALGDVGCSAVVPGTLPGEWAIDLNEGMVLGMAVAALVRAGLVVVSCREPRSAIEDAFAHLVTLPR